MATRKSKAAQAEITEQELDQAIEELAKPLPGVVKEFTQNGIKYRRIRTEKGDLVDVRI